LNGIVVEPGLDSEDSIGIWLRLAQSVGQLVPTIGNHDNLTVRDAHDFSQIRRLRIMTCRIDELGRVAFPNRSVTGDARTPYR